MSNSIVKKVTELHNRLAQVIGPMRGREVKTADVKAAWIAAFPELSHQEQWIMLSDHCSNRSNKGACLCAESELALFERIEEGLYRVL
jgi:hypothetical protein